MKKAMYIAVVVALLAACSTDRAEPNTTAVDAPTTVSTSSGVLHGKTVGNTHQFTGVRYARPPVGNLRWTLPQAISQPDAPMDATGPGHPCPQTPGLGSGTTASPSEDCLYLNVTTPRKMTAGRSLPVMVWWHGGGYTAGSGIGYDPQRIADAGDVVVVTVNYRLGIFGYFGAPGLPGSGDFGFADQLESLRWVKRNVSAFGGDAANVTVFGESAGGMSTCAALTSPAARGLIDKAIISSGSCDLRWPAGTFYPGVPTQTPYVSLADNLATAAAAAQQLGCTGSDSLTCLRSLPVDRLMTQNQNFSNDLAYGTELLPRNPADAVRNGDTLAVPVISGGNHDENRAFTGGVVIANPTAVTATTYPTLLADAFGSRAADVAARYPLSGFASAPLAWATVLTDSGWSCPTLRGARELAARSPVYSYEFSDDTAPNIGHITTPLVPQAATHASDVPYLFDLNGSKNLVPDGHRAELSRNMIAYWTSFARTGKPSADGAPEWPTTSPTSTTVLAFDESGIHTAGFDTDHQCGFWNTVEVP